MSNVVNYAARICEFLSQEKIQQYAVPTSRLLAECNISTGLRPQVLKVLHKLHYIGVLMRHGIGSLKWQIRNLNWDRSNPFRTPVTLTPDEQALIQQQDSFKKKKSPAKYQYSNSPKPVFQVADDPQSEADQTSYPQIDTALLGEALEQIHQLKKRVHELESTSSMTGEFAKIEIASPMESVELTDVILPKVFRRTLELAQARRNILLIGPAGCGKTYLGKLIASSLNLPFGSLSCTSGMSEAHLLGRGIPNLQTGKNIFQMTPFIELYENGGVFLMDELDAADPNLLLAINSAIANDYCNVPNRVSDPVATRHKNFVMIATANTFGRGSTRLYAGRNQLDEATLDRFRIGMVECDYDPIIERALCPTTETDPGLEFTPPENGHNTAVERAISSIVGKGFTFRGCLQYVRSKIEQHSLRRIMSTRFMQDAYIMHQSANWNVNTVLDVFFEGWSNDELTKVSG